MNEQKRIIIADNEALDMDFLDLMLSKVGFEVEKAEDGKIALEKIWQLKPDVIILNTILPKVSGWEILKTVKTSADMAFAQILLLSDMDNVKERAESYELGAEDYITKPFNFSVLIAKIRAILRNRDYFYKLSKNMENNT